MKKSGGEKGRKKEWVSVSEMVLFPEKRDVISWGSYFKLLNVLTLLTLHYGKTELTAHLKGKYTCSQKSHQSLDHSFHPSRSWSVWVFLAISAPSIYSNVVMRRMCHGPRLPGSESVLLHILAL
jgi:hypothetical protein